MIIKLYDNENYEYPLIEIKDGENPLKEFNKFLKEYQKQCDYNLDEFLSLLEEKDFYIKCIYHDEEVFF